jgi:DnaJ-class molecular chaperone
MGKDYYQDLDISREAIAGDITKAYKSQCLKWHPKVSKKEASIVNFHFCKISEAYEVLSDRKYFFK